MQQQWECSLSCLTKKSNLFIIKIIQYVCFIQQFYRILKAYLPLSSLSNEENKNDKRNIINCNGVNTNVFKPRTNFLQDFIVSRKDLNIKRNH